jgi:hypothetical protein
LLAHELTAPVSLNQAVALWHFSDEIISALHKQCSVVSIVLAQLHNIDEFSRSNSTMLDHVTTLRSQLVHLVGLLLSILQVQVNEQYDSHQHQTVLNDWLSE